MGFYPVLYTICSCGITHVLMKPEHAYAVAPLVVQMGKDFNPMILIGKFCECIGCDEVIELPPAELLDWERYQEVGAEVIADDTL